MIVPQGATYQLQDKRFIYTLGAENKVTAVAITSSPTDDGRYFLVSEGLKPGDKVVIEGVSSLRDGVSIIPKEVNAVSFNENIN